MVSFVSSNWAGALCGSPYSFAGLILGLIFMRYWRRAVERGQSVYPFDNDGWAQRDDITYHGVSGASDTGKVKRVGSWGIFLKTG